MAQQMTLNASPRTLAGKQSKTLKKSGKLPAVLYGHEVESQKLEINEKEFYKLFKQAGESTIFSLNVDSKTYPVLIQDVQNPFLNDRPIHVDFYAVNMKEKLTATIPIHLLGDAPA